MDFYEEMISRQMNQIAGKEIYFHADEILCESSEISSSIIGLLLSFACSATNITPIDIARNCLQQFPTDWISEKIKQTAFSSINIYDDWDYRRLLELSELISEDLLNWVISLGENSDNPDILEAVNDFKED